MLIGESKTLGQQLGDKTDSLDLREETLALFAVIHHIQPYDDSDSLYHIRSLNLN
jgi:hypothetical protein